jgi:hypothetical protein
LENIVALLTRTGLIATESYPDGRILLYTSPPAMTDKNADLIPLTRFRTALASPRAEKRIDALISADNAEEVVQALSVTDLYFLIEEVGLADCVELLSLCSNEQIQGCVDLEIWDRDQPLLEAFFPWLAAIQENGFEFLGRVWAGMDPELTALTLARCCDIYDKTLDEEVPDEEERGFFETPDTFFQIVITTDDEVQSKLVHTIIEDLYRADMVQARHTLMSARSEPAAELEEMSYRWRSGRMADLGYVDFYEALEVFRPIDPASVQIGEGTAEHRGEKIESEVPIASDLPAPMLRPVIGRGFLAQALEGLEDQAEIESMQSALLYLVNRLMSAGSLSPGNAEALELATVHATASVALGLEYDSQGNPEQAVEALRSISLTRLHRLGYTLCLRLARFARMVAGRAITAGEPSISVLEAVLAKRPFFPVVLENPASSDIRPIESRADLASIADHLKELALRIAVADALEVDLAALAELPEPRPQLDDYARSALLRASLPDADASSLNPAPLRREELEAFRDSLGDDGVLLELREHASSSLVKLLDAGGVVEARDSLGKLIEQWFSELEENFLPLPKDQPIEGKFLSLLLLASSAN